MQEAFVHNIDALVTRGYLDTRFTEFETRVEAHMDGRFVEVDKRFTAMEARKLLYFQELVEHTRADALVTVAEHFLATCGENKPFQALKGSERCQIMLHVDINTLRQHALTEDVSGAGAHECCHLDEKPWISPDTARRLACDASLVTVLEDENGQVLNIGRRSRIVPAHIRRALSIRDKTCCVPGCTQSRYIDAHHLVHWADGGETSLDNLVQC